MSTIDKIKEETEVAIDAIKEVFKNEVEAIEKIVNGGKDDQETDTTSTAEQVQPTNTAATPVEEIKEYFIQIHKYEFGRLTKREKQFVGVLSDAVTEAKKFMTELAGSGYKIVNKFGESVDISKLLNQTGDYA